MKKTLSASFTVEASLLLPPVLLTLLTVLFLSAHIHNRSVLLSRAAEQALTGSEMMPEVLFLVDSATRTAESGKRSRTVRYTLETIPLLTPHRWTGSPEAAYEMPDCVGILQKAAAAKAIKGG